jgi:hypothetical protein
MAQPDLAAIKRCLSEGAFRQLFIEELGWDNVHVREVEVVAEGRRYVYEAIAQKRGMLLCVAAWPDGIPDHRTRSLLERALARLHFEHIVVYLDGTERQVWVWARREPGESVRLRSHWLHPGQSGELLAQQLSELHVSLDDESKLTLVGITSQARRAFDPDSITRSFYGDFQVQQRAFQEFIKGLPLDGDRAWYSSVMLNRLMFTYFVQKKGFLDGDVDYLPNRLQALQNRMGPGRFLSFYRHFLLRLFHGGFSRLTVEPDQVLDELIGNVPYINGGLFGVHQLEARFPDIDIPDEAFTRLFDFFGQWKWHLDERPLRDGREINPDVLGYIFEKYINQKELGAYYTKEDITGYMAGATVLPVLLERVEALCAVAFRPDGPLWGMLRENPDRYIHDAMLHGMETALPADVVIGESDLGNRVEWNSVVPSGEGLPTELWREFLVRRRRVQELRSRLVHGEVHDVGALVSANLNVRQFVQDAIDTAEGGEVVRAFYQALLRLTILDPACGSGAFLFAALITLAPLYDACLARMSDFVEDPGAGGVAGLDDFIAILEDVGRHPNRTYFVLKTIAMRNLYGVDIVEEAVEICRLRLFLKLAAQLGSVSEIEPLPDIDFNIRPGNSLVGYSSLDALQRTVHHGALDFSGSGEELLDALRDLQHELAHYRTDQLKLGGPLPGSKAKVDLEGTLRALADDLDRFMAAGRGVDVDSEAAYDEWHRGHQPLQWPVEFAQEVAAGGFDVVIGNPPYVELEKVDGYTVDGFATLDCGNTYALFFERGLELLKADGRLSFVVPVSSVSVDGYRSLRKLLLPHDHFYSSYDDRPSRLFDGLEHIRLTIHLVGRRRPTPTRFSTGYLKWYGKERPHLFHVLHYTQPADVSILPAFPKMSDPFEGALLQTLAGEKRRFGQYVGASGHGVVYYTRKVGYFLQVLDFQPRITDESGHLRPPSELKVLHFRSERLGRLALCVLNSGLFYWFFTVFSDCRNLNRREIDGFPIDLDALDASTEGDRLDRLAPRLMKTLQGTSEERTMSAGRGKGNLRVQCIFPMTAKPLIDEIDLALGGFLGLGAETVDAIQNYEIKYRLGLGK